MNQPDLLPLILPEAILVAAALACLAVGAIKSIAPQRHARLAFVLSQAALALAFCASLWWMPEGRLVSGMLVMSPLTRIFSAFVIALGAGAIVLMQVEPVRRHAAENIAVLLFAIVGLLLMVATENLLMVFVGLELAGLSFYILAGFTQENRRGAAAALKYFLFGSVAAAFLLYGLSLVYGVTGSLDLKVISNTPVGRLADPLMLAGLVMVFAGFGFKVAAVPFHLWAPDVYRHAPVPAAALIASGSKVAGFFLLAKLLIDALGPSAGAAAWGGFILGWAPLLAVSAALSMTVGNLAALGQSSVRRMLAFSGVGQAGFLLAALTGPGASAAQAVCFYLVVYGVATLGAFGVVSVVQARSGDDRLRDFAGLGKSSPLAAACMTVFLMSLAGLPPLAGFVGKFALFTTTMSAGEAAGAPVAPGMLWLVALALATSALSLYYYLQVLKHMYFTANADETKSDKPGTLVCTVLVLLAAALLVLGVAPGLLADCLSAALYSR